MRRFFFLGTRSTIPAPVPVPSASWAAQRDRSAPTCPKEAMFGPQSPELRTGARVAVFFGPWSALGPTLVRSWSSPVPLASHEPSPLFCTDRSASTLLLFLPGRQANKRRRAHRPLSTDRQKKSTWSLAPWDLWGAWGGDSPPGQTPTLTPSISPPRWPIRPDDLDQSTRNRLKGTKHPQSPEFADLQLVFLGKKVVGVRLLGWARTYIYIYISPTSPPLSPLLFKKLRNANNLTTRQDFAR